MLFLFVETTGLGGLPKDDFVQVSVVDMQGCVLLDSLADPGIQVSCKAEAVHGITTAMLAGSPSTDELRRRVYDLCRGQSVGIYDAGFECRYFPALTDIAEVIDVSAEYRNLGCTVYARPSQAARAFGLVSGSTADAEAVATAKLYVRLPEWHVPSRYFLPDAQIHAAAIQDRYEVPSSRSGLGSFARLLPKEASRHILAQSARPTYEKPGPVTIPGIEVKRQLGAIDLARPVLAGWGVQERPTVLEHMNSLRLQSMSEVRLCGVVKSYRQRRSSNTGQPMIVADLQDRHGRFSVLFCVSEKMRNIGEMQDLLLSAMEGNDPVIVDANLVDRAMFGQRANLLSVLLAPPTKSEKTKPVLVSPTELNLLEQWQARGPKAIWEVETAGAEMALRFQDKQLLEREYNRARAVISQSPSNAAIRVLAEGVEAIFKRARSVD